MRKLSVGILGATGVIGQQLLAQLKDHPWFEVTTLRASDASIGENYGSLTVQSLDDPYTCDFVFSALPNELAQIYEPQLAQSGISVITSASAHRNTADIPLIIPEVNASHIKILDHQKKGRGWKGFIAAKPNCTLQSFLIPLAPLHRQFQIDKIFLTTLQAISGAGKSLDPSLIEDNVIPFIENEEEKTETEPLKILGSLKEGHIQSDPSISISAHCNRIPVTHGHLSCLSVSFRKKTTIEEILKIWSSSSELKLPTAPAHPILYSHESNRPQTRLDRDAGQGMSVTVGRLRTCPILDWRFVSLSHNLIRGGAGGSLLLAELLYQEGYLG